MCVSVFLCIIICLNYRCLSVEMFLIFLTFSSLFSLSPSIGPFVQEPDLTPEQQERYKDYEFNTHYEAPETTVEQVSTTHKKPTQKQKQRTTTKKYQQSDDSVGGGGQRGGGGGGVDDDNGSSGETHSSHNNPSESDLFSEIDHENLVSVTLGPQAGQGSAVDRPSFAVIPHGLQGHRDSVSQQRDDEEEDIQPPAG